MSRRVPIVLLACACLLAAFASAAGAAAPRAWTLKRAVKSGERYEVVLRFAATPRKSTGAVLVTGTAGLRRVVDPRAARSGVVRVAVRPRGRRVLVVRVRVLRGRPRLIRATLRRVPPAATSTASTAPALAAPPAVPALAASAPAPAGPAAPTTVSTPPSTTIVVTPPATDLPPTTTTPPAADAPAAEPSPSAGRKLLFADEFDGPAGPLPSDSAWDPQEGAGWGTGQLQSYTSRPENVRLDGEGHLAIVARKERYTGWDGETVDYTSARLQTLGRFSFTYGRVEARMKLPAGTGLWPAFWMLGDDIYTKGWPECGEIDVMETIGSFPDQLNGTVHGPKGPWSGDPNADGEQWERGEAVDSDTSLTDRFHTYAAEWTADAIELSFDGKPYSTITKASLPAGARWTFDHPSHLLLNLAVGGEWPGAPTAATAFPAALVVDYVRVYAAA